VKIFKFRGNTARAEEAPTGWVATLIAGPALDAWREQGGNGFPFFASRDLGRLRGMIVSFITGRND
jgi:hypothetical protein